MNEKDHYSVVITEADAAIRLDKILPQYISSLSRSRIAALIENGQVRLESGAVIADAAYKVKAGQVFSVTIPQVTPTHIVAQDIPLDIVYEDRDFLVINKPPGLTVHPAPGHADETLVNALLAHCGESLSGIGGVARPGIVHRIDKDTSGLLAVAKHDVAHAHLSAQLADRTLKRTYLALVWGVLTPSSGSISGDIGRSPVNRKKMAVVAKNGKPATTHYKTLEVFTANGKPFASLVECNLETGRTHQIRVHLTHKGHPMIGDPVYGASTASKLAAIKKYISEEALEVLAAFNRQALHAYRLGVIHPVSGEAMEFEAQMPEDMAELLRVLKQ